MKEANTSTEELTANCPFTCYSCGESGVDTSAHYSRKWGLCVNCGAKVSLD